MLFNKVPTTLRLAKSELLLPKRSCYLYDGMSGTWLRHRHPAITEVSLVEQLTQRGVSS